MRLVDRVGFDASFSFVYSARPGTPAAALADEVPLVRAKARLARLQARIRELAAQVNHAMVGATEQVLVERASRKDPRQMSGRTANNRWVNFDGDASLIGSFVPVRITEALPNSLRGVLEQPRGLRSARARL